MEEQTVLEGAIRGRGSVELARILGVDRHTVARWLRKPPPWLAYALLGVAASKGERERALQLLQRATFLVDPWGDW